MYIISVEQSKETDKKTMRHNNTDLINIIYKAGNAVYETLRSEYPPLYTKKICIVCGKGHNGADGLALALILKRLNISCYILIAANQGEICAESAYYLEKLNHLKAEIVFINSKNIDTANQYLSLCDIIVDALLGTGLNKDVTGIYSALISLINIQNKHIVSVDIPSGINGDNGRVMHQAVRADIAVVMQYLKYGNILNDADDHCEKKIIKDIGLAKISGCGAILLQKEEAFKNIKKIKHNIHKYDKGNILFFGGSKSMEGSVILSASACFRSGAGLVHIAAPSDAYMIVSIKSPCEVMVHEIKKVSDLTGLLNKKSVIAAGMGLKDNINNYELIKILLNSDIPLILDATAFSIIARNKKILAQKKAKTVLTPHTKELSVLMGCENEDIISDPVSMAKKAACEYDSVVVLKMNKIIIANQNGDVRICDTKNNAMATAGSGDVLAGIIASNVTYCDNLFAAACAGVYMHARAGIRAAEKYGKRYMNASDIIAGLSIVEKELLTQ